MARLQHSLLHLLLLALVSPSLTTAWGGPWGNGDDCDDPYNGTSQSWWGPGRGNRWGNHNDDDNSSDSTTSPTNAGITASAITSINNVLIAHAVMACLAWAFFFPLGGILLHLPTASKSALPLRLHVVCQMVSSLLFLAAAGLGIWLAQQISFGGFPAWSDPHTGIGIAILILAAIQPVLGSVHHKLFKKRLAANSERKALEGGADEKPRTTPGFMHVWLGRALLVLGIVNGGLGIRLAARTRFQSQETTTSAAIGYGVGAGVMFLAYVLSAVLFARRKGREEAVEDDDGLPSYSESDRSPSYSESQTVSSLEKPRA